MNILKEDVLAAFGTHEKAAEALGITRVAVTMWKNGRPIPKLREYQLRELYPEKFPSTRRVDAAC